MPTEVAPTGGAAPSPAPVPGGADGAATIAAALHGIIAPHPWRTSAPGTPDAYILFRARSVAMGWQSGTVPGATAGSWSVEDAGADEIRVWDHPGRVAWFQARVTDPVLPERPLPIQPFLACAGHVVARLGQFELHGAQVLVPMPVLGRRAGGHPLGGIDSSMSAATSFVDIEPSATTAVRVTVEGDMGADPSAAVTDALHWIRPVRQTVLRPRGLTSDAVVLEPGVGEGLWTGRPEARATFSATMAEWSLDAIGWAVAFFAEVMHQHGVRRPLLVSVARG